MDYAITVATGFVRPYAEPSLKPMFAARKRVFIDLLGWNVPTVASECEADQFDAAHAEYLIVADRQGRHLASARLLPTTRPHILDSLFPQLCIGQVPRGPAVREVTRFCLEPSVGAQVRREARCLLVSALVQHALSDGIECFTGVAEVKWLEQIRRFGWRCRLLGNAQDVQGAALGSVAIEISPQTPALLRVSGMNRRVSLTRVRALEAV